MNVYFNGVFRNEKSFCSFILFFICVQKSLSWKSQSEDVNGPGSIHGFNNGDFFGREKSRL